MLKAIWKLKKLRTPQISVHENVQYKETAKCDFF